MLLAQRVLVEVMVDSEDGDEPNILPASGGYSTPIKSTQVKFFGRLIWFVDILLTRRHYNLTALPARAAS